MIPMQQAAARKGRKDKGDRVAVLTRPPLALAEAVRAAADEADMSISDYVANVLAAAHGFPPVVGPKDDRQMRIAV